MPSFFVTVRHTELITFVIEADDETDAGNRVLYDGEEVMSVTKENEVVLVTSAESQGI
jgi:hypothetical protein